MAGERILIAKLGGRDCPVETNDNICLLGCSCESCNGGVSRQEAIERMAKAIYDFEIVACSHEECGNKQCENCETWKWCENIAEAALNALLEVDK